MVNRTLSLSDLAALLPRRDASLTPEERFTNWANARVNDPARTQLAESVFTSCLRIFVASPARHRCDINAMMRVLEDYHAGRSIELEFQRQQPSRIQAFVRFCVDHKIEAAHSVQSFNTIYLQSGNDFRIRPPGIDLVYIDSRPVALSLNCAEKAGREASSHTEQDLLGGLSLAVDGKHAFDYNGRKVAALQAADIVLLNVGGLCNSESKLLRFSTVGPLLQEIYRRRVEESLQRLSGIYQQVCDEQNIHPRKHAIKAAMRLRRDEFPTFDFGPRR